MIVGSVMNFSDGDAMELHMTLKIRIRYLPIHLISELILPPKLPYFATVTCALAPGMASVHTRLLATNIRISPYVPGKTQ